MSEKFFKHLANPLYVKAKRVWEEVRHEQIKKGSEKYPEPLNPESWTPKQLVRHGIQENVDQLHYYVALEEKFEAMEQHIAYLESELKRARAGFYPIQIICPECQKEYNPNSKDCPRCRE